MLSICVRAQHLRPCSAPASMLSTWVQAQPMHLWITLITYVHAQHLCPNSAPCPWSASVSTLSTHTCGQHCPLVITRCSLPAPGLYCSPLNAQRSSVLLETEGSHKRENFQYFQPGVLLAYTKKKKIKKQKSPACCEHLLWEFRLSGIQIYFKPKFHAFYKLLFVVVDVCAFLISGNAQACGPFCMAFLSLDPFGCQKLKQKGHMPPCSDTRGSLRKAIVNCKLHWITHLVWAFL